MDSVSRRQTKPDMTALTGFPSDRGRCEDSSTQDKRVEVVKAQFLEADSGSIGGGCDASCATLAGKCIAYQKPAPPREERVVRKDPSAPGKVEAQAKPSVGVKFKTVGRLLLKKKKLMQQVSGQRLICRGLLEHEQRDTEIFLKQFNAHGLCDQHSDSDHFIDLTEVPGDDDYGLDGELQFDIEICEESDEYQLMMGKLCAILKTHKVRSVKIKKPQMYNIDPYSCITRSPKRDLGVCCCSIYISSADETEKQTIYKALLTVMQEINSTATKDNKKSSCFTYSSEHIKAQVKSFTPKKRGYKSIGEFFSYSGWSGYRDDVPPALLALENPDVISKDHTVEEFFSRCHPQKLFFARFFLNPQLKLSTMDAFLVYLGNKFHYSKELIVLEDEMSTFGIDSNKENMRAIKRFCDMHAHYYVETMSEVQPQYEHTTINFTWLLLNPQDKTARDIFEMSGGKGRPLTLPAETKEDLEQRLIESVNELSCRMTEAEYEEACEEIKQIKAKLTLCQTPLYKIVNWMRKNPHAEVNLWFDSRLITRQALTNTRAVVEQVNAEFGHRLRLADINTLAVPEEYDSIRPTLGPGSPLYYRIDLTKALIAQHCMDDPNSRKYCIVTDIDIQAMSPKELFDEQTRSRIDHYGFVINGKGSEGFENSFFVFDTNNPKICQIHKENILGALDQKLKEEKTLDSQGAYSFYGTGLMDDHYEAKKFVQCPGSQFTAGGSFWDKPKDHRNEKFTLTAYLNILTTQGRAYNPHGFSKILTFDNFNPHAQFPTPLLPL